MITEYIIEEINEFGEIEFELIIPLFLKFKYGKELTLPIPEHEENYIISDNDFLLLRDIVIELIFTKKLALFFFNKYAINPILWRDFHVMVEKVKTLELLYEKNTWESQKCMPNYCLTYEENAYFG